MDLSRGTLLVLAGVGLFVTTMAVGAVTAPDRTIGATEGGPATPAGAPTASDAPTPTDGVDPGDGTATDGTPTPTATPAPDAPQTLVGMQGGWVTHGSVFKFDGHDEAWRVTNADGYFEVSVLDDGRIAAAFSNESVQTDCAPYDSPCGRTGFRIIDPDAAGGPAVVSEYSFATRRQHNREVHAVDALGGDRFAFADMDRERIVVVENGTEVWEWRASSFYDAPDDPTGRDWLHINDVDAIGDERFLVSVRNANQLLVVERDEGVVDVINEDRDGDDSSCLESRQLLDADETATCAVATPPCSITSTTPSGWATAASSSPTRRTTGIVELRERNGTWTPVWTLSEAHGIPLYWPRDADRLPNGDALVTDSLNRRVFVTRPNGTVVWSYATDRIPYEADAVGVGEAAGGLPRTGAGDDGMVTRSDDGDNGTAPANDDGTATSTATDPTPPDDDVPVLSTLLVGVQAVVPQTPIRFEEMQLGLSLLSLVLVTGGITDRLRGQ